MVAWDGAIGYGIIVSTKNFLTIIAAVACSAILTSWLGSEPDSNGNVV